MDYKIIISNEADRDIDEIVRYIAEILKNPIVARNLLNEIEKSYIQISQAPESYSYCSDKRLRDKGYRKILIKNYILFYRIDYKNNIVYVMRVIYGRRNYTDLI